MLKIDLRERDDVVIADLVGRLTVGAGEQALRECIAALLARGRSHIVLNLAHVEFIDSSGLGELVRALRAARAGALELKILNVEGHVYNTLSLARLLPLFEVYDSEEEVVTSFARGGTQSQEPSILSTVHGHVATLTLNRPRRFNALTREMLSELVTAIAALRSDRSVRAVVLVGAGRGFCFGADAEELREGEGALPTLELLQAVIRDLATFPKPVVAALNGFATGAGLDLALACDLRVMSRKAKLASAFVRFGLVPDGGSTHTLPRLVGAARAAELVLSGRTVEADEALAWGLVNRVVDASEVLGVAASWAAELGRGPARAMARAKLLLRSGPNASLDQALEAEAREQATCFGDAEFSEGLRAHTEKREPIFPA